MDAATLVITTIDGGPTAWAKMFRAVGRHASRIWCSFFNLADDLEAGVEREEFEVARLRLERTDSGCTTPTHRGTTSLSSGWNTPAASTLSPPLCHTTRAVDWRPLATQTAARPRRGATPRIPRGRCPCRVAAEPDKIVNAPENHWSRTRFSLPCE